MEQSKADACAFSFFHVTGALAAAEQLMAHVNALLEHDTQYEPHSTNDLYHDAVKHVYSIVRVIQTDVVSRFPNRLHVECALAAFLHDLITEDVKAVRDARLHDLVQWLQLQDGKEKA